MAREYRKSGIGIFIFNPGVVDSDMLHRLTFIPGYEAKIKIFKTVMGILMKPPGHAAEKAVWLASSVTDGRTGKMISLVGPATMAGGLAADRAEPGYGRRRVDKSLGARIEAIHLFASRRQARPWGRDEFQHRFAVETG